MGRPPLPKDKSKTAAVGCYATAAQVARYKQAAEVCGFSMSEVCRTLFDSFANEVLEVSPPVQRNAAKRPMRKAARIARAELEGQKTRAAYLVRRRNSKPPSDPTQNDPTE